MIDLYYVAVGCLLVYICVLIALNRIPHVSIGYIGLLSIRHVTIELNTTTIFIKKLALRFNFLKSRKKSGLKLINFEVIDVNVTQRNDQNQLKKKDKLGEMKDISIEDQLYFRIPKRFFDYIISTGIINNINIRIFRCSIFSEKFHHDLLVFLDYTRLEAKLDANNDIRFTVTLVTGSLQSNSTQELKANLYRNVEFYINCKTIATCAVNNTNLIDVHLSDFKISLSIGRLNIPLAVFQRDSDKNVTFTDSSDQRRGSEDDGLKEDIDLTKYSKMIQDIMKVYTLTELRLEDSTLSNASMSMNLSNFVMSLTKIEKEDSDNLKLSIYVASYKIFHKGTKCFELPSGTLSYEVNPVQVVQVSQVLLNHEGASTETINFDLSVMLTNPTFDFYYDQQEIIFAILRNNMTKRRMRRMRKAAGVDRKDEIITKLILASKMLKEISTRLVIVDTTLHIHLPPLSSPRDEESEFNRMSKDNLKITFSLSALIHKLFTKNYQKLFRSRNKARKKPSIDAYFKLKEFSGEVDGNQTQISKIDALMAYNLQDNSIAIKVASKTMSISSVNDIIFYTVRQFRNRQRIYFNQKYTEIMNEIEAYPDESESILEGLGQDGDDEVRYVKLFEFLPSIISSVKIDLKTILVDIICKEGLPNHIIFDEKLKKEVNLADFRRGVSLKISDVGFNYSRSKELLDSSVKSIQLFTLSEYSSEYIDDFDQVSDFHLDSDFNDLSTISSISSSTIGDFGEYEEEESSSIKRIKNVLHIRNLSISNNKSGDRKADPNRLMVSVSEIDSRVDMFFVWCIFYAKTLLKQFAPTVESNCSKEALKRISGPSKVVKLDVVLDSVSLVARLPNKVDILIEVDSAQLRNAIVLKSVEINHIRLYVVHPATKLWARLLVISQPLFSIDVSKTYHDGKFEISPQAIRFEIPNQFLFYTVIDNSISFFKAIKQLSHNFKFFHIGFERFDRVFPGENSAVKFPYVRIKTPILGLILENDPFENELAMIYEIGAIEQRLRLKKLKEFEKKSEEILEGAKCDDEGIEEKIELSNEQAPNNAPRINSTLRTLTSNSKNSGSPTRNSSSGSETKVSQGSSLFKDKIFRRRRHKQIEDIAEEDEQEMGGYTVEDAELRIEEAKRRLYQNFSCTWISKFRVFKQERQCSWKKRGEAVWGKDEISQVMKDKYEILDHSVGIPLMGAVFRDFDLVLDKFTHTQDLDKFLYDYAKQQPKLVYSILCPFSLDLKARKLYMFLRDYPIPLVSFPTNSDPTKPTIHVQANLVINEKLFERKEELRHIFVGYSPAIDPNVHKVDNFYSVYIPRTLTPVKLACDLRCDLNADRACMISWCKSYQPSLSMMFQAFDNFTKPAIDDSPLGWWDKVPLMMHGKFQFNIPNELCLHMKSSTDPHDLVGRASGFVFCWKNNVTLTIDATKNNSKELIVLESDDFMFAVPNYSDQERNIWSLFYDEHDDLSQHEDLEAKKFYKRVIKLTSDDRVKWIFGMMFERNKHPTTKALSDQEIRVSKFKPHYEIVVTNPAEDYHPDSYEGYRSDYIHMSLAVISKSKAGNSHNAIYLSPLTFQYFFYWWDLLIHHNVMPVRNGSLFQDRNQVKKSHVKMGPHLFTIKYQLVFNPVIVSHMYIHSTSDVPDKNNRIAFTGLKGKFTKFEVDLHQRKETVIYLNKKLHRQTKVRHLKMNQAEINLENADVRLLNAIFPDKCITARLVTYLDGSKSSTGSSTTTSSSSSGGDNYKQTFSGWVDTIEMSDNDFSWIDHDDFVELELKKTLSPYPKIKVVPFFFTPRFSYFREFALQKDGPFPFGNETIHDCLMDLTKPAEVQRQILRERIDLLEDDLTNKEDFLRKLRIQNAPEYQYYINVTEKEIQMLKEKLDVVYDAWRSFEEVADDITDDDGNTLLSKQASGLSAYSSHRSQSDLLEAISHSHGVVEFHNRFIIHNLQLKWDDRIRELAVEYLQSVSDRKNAVYFMSNSAVDLVESIINETLQGNAGEPISMKRNHSYKEFKKSEEIIDSFEDEIDEISNPNQQEAEYKYVVKLINPQIQLVSDKNPDSCVLITSRDLEMRILGINLKDTVNVLNSDVEMTGVVETRYGVLFRDAQVFVVGKDDSALTNPKSKFTSGYSSSENNWPPWFECEVCYDGSWVHSYMVSERNSMALIFKEPNPLFLDSSSGSSSVGGGTILPENEITVYLAKYVINATSAQYSSIYYVITDLLVYSKTGKDNMTGRLQKVMTLSDSDDFRGLDIRIRELQQSIREYKSVLLSIDVRRIVLDEKDRQCMNVLELEVERMRWELLLLMKGLRLRHKSKAKQTARYWDIVADQVIWHLLDDNREPFIDFALAGARYHRVDSIDGSKFNKVEISMVQGFNLQNKTVYPQLLTPYLEEKVIQSEQERNREGCTNEKPIVSIAWTMLDAVGGISIIKDAKLDIEPLRLELDYTTAKRLVSYLFPDENEATFVDSSGDNDEEVDEDEEEAASSIQSSGTSRASRNPLRKLLSKTRAFSNNSSGNSSNSSNGSTTSSRQSSSQTRASSEQSSSAGTSSQEDDSLGLGQGPKCKFMKVHRKRLDDSNDEDNLAIIIGRSMKYKSIIDISVSNFTLFVSFTGPKSMHLLDVDKLVINVPNLRYSNKIWSAEEFMDRLKKDIIKVIISHTGKILGNKFKPKKRISVNEPLKQISNYGKYMTLDDLQKQGRERRVSLIPQEVPESSPTPQSVLTRKQSMITKTEATDATYATYLAGNSTLDDGEDEEFDDASQY
ncbi:uncharacterized protein J8A68_004555 [[Candida] subhashii]|uniref:Uncharacterized protein n=1 Tax=[Candida] subhashii TaxID=561895 RepID=A0A8J5UKB8_9ASCO|nr:uncharacterized protein J8A68_004555 [[Candida] subhashii]KAG7661952.1 hypothetical protein J8A68_004555 [[Candida] subhashii]